MSTEANKAQTLARKVGSNENARWVLFAQLILAALIWWALSQSIELVWRAAGGPRWEFFGGIHVANFIALAISGGALIYTLRNTAAQDFANEVVVELRKVSWPNAKEVRQSTLVVVVLVFIVSSILGGFDLVWSKVIKYLLTYGSM